MNAKRKAPPSSSSSEKDSAVKPQIIDLAPEDVIVERDAAPSEIPDDPPVSESHAASSMDSSTDGIQSEAASSPYSSSSSSSAHTSTATPARAASKRMGMALPIAALALGLVGGGWIYRDYISDYFPTNQVTALEAKLQTVEAASKSTADQLSSLATLAEQLKSDVDNLEAGMVEGKTASAKLQTTLTENAGRFGQLETALGETAKRIEALKSTMATAGTATATTTTAVDPAILASLNQRIDALEKDVSALNAAKAAVPDSSALSQTLSDIKAKIAAGTPFEAELTRIKTLVPAAEGLDDLEAFAVEGLPTAQGLAQELVTLSATLPKPPPPVAEDDSYWASFTGMFKGLITVKTIGEADWPTVAQSAAASAEAGDLTAAIAIIDKADGDKPGALRAWRDRAEARLRLEAALARTSEAVMRQIAAKG